MGETKPVSAREKQEATWFKPGQSGNPAGRKVGSRNKLQEDFLKDVLAAWKAKGATAIDDMIEDKPGDFVKMVAGLMPKEATLTINDNSELTDDELADRIRQLAAQLAPFLADGDADGPKRIDDKRGKTKPVELH